MSISLAAFVFSPIHLDERRQFNEGVLFPQTGLGSIVDFALEVCGSQSCAILFRETHTGAELVMAADVGDEHCGDKGGASGDSGKNVDVDLGIATAGDMPTHCVNTFVGAVKETPLYIVLDEMIRSEPLTIRRRRRAREDPFVPPATFTASDHVTAQALARVDSYRPGK